MRQAFHAYYLVSFSVQPNELRRERVLSYFPEKVDQNCQLLYCGPGSLQVLPSRLDGRPFHGLFCLAVSQVIMDSLWPCLSPETAEEEESTNRTFSYSWLHIHWLPNCESRVGHTQWATLPASKRGVSPGPGTGREYVWPHSRGSSL